MTFTPLLVLHLHQRSRFVMKTERSAKLFVFRWALMLHSIAEILPVDTRIQVKLCNSSGPLVYLQRQVSLSSPSRISAILDPNYQHGCAHVEKCFKYGEVRF